MVLEYLSACAIDSAINGSDEGLSGMDIASSFSTIGMIIALLISLATAYLAYICNKRSNIVVKVVSTIVGFLFSGIYLVYYLLVHVLFGEQCKGTKINLFKKGKSIFKGRKIVKRKKSKKKKR